MAPHGSAARYNYHSCRCSKCKESQRVYSKIRRSKNPHPNRLVPAGPTAKHLRKLRRHKVGLRSLRDITGMSFSHLRLLRAGKKQFVQLRTERKILQITGEAYAGGARISSVPTAIRLRRLRQEGFTYSRLAVQLKLWPETLMKIVNRKALVRASTEMKVEKFYNKIMAA